MTVPDMPSERHLRFATFSMWAMLAVLSAAILTAWLQGSEPWLVGLWETALFALAGGWTGRMVFSPVAARGGWVLLPLAAPVAIGAAQLLRNTTVYRWATFSRVIEWGVYAATAFLAFQICSSGEIQVRLRRAVVYFGFAVAAISVLQFFTSLDKVFWLFKGEYAEPSLGPFVSRDRYAALMELVLPLALFEAFAERRVAVSYTAMAATMVASVIAGASRAGSILVVAESAALFLLMPRSRTFRSPQAIRVAFSFVLLGVVFTAIVGWTNLWERFQDPDPYRYRREMLASGLAMVRERPWSGFGLGTFETVYPAYALFDTGEVVNHAHNDWLEWAVEGGLPMMIALLVVPLAVVRRVVERPWLLGVVSVLIHSAVDFPMQDPAIALWVCALTGAGLSKSITGAADLLIPRAASAFVHDGN